MKLEYCVVKEKYMAGEREYTAFGVALLEACGEEYSVLAAVHNVCAEHGKVAKLAEKCNRLGLSPVHLEEAVLDMLNEI